ncbi:MAG: hypothetical protein N2036_06315 [Bryobacteraceae bacterium]|nr:hypothetical protein [Bryobacteraceae bacterium]MCX7603671.1 hypothetical protein [Bryobacteraceae bacterium]
MILRIRPGCFRFTTILATTKRGWERFDNLDEMPPVLRARCLRALESRNSGTVLIAGRSRPDGSEEPAAAALPAEPPRAAGALRTAGLAAAIFQILLAGLAAAWYFRLLP